MGPDLGQRAADQSADGDQGADSNGRATRRPGAKPPGTGRASGRHAHDEPCLGVAMKLSGANTNLSRASVLIIVLWVAFGLIAMTLYFAHAMSMELKAADNQTASIEADQAIEGAALYVSNVLANRPNPLGLPDTNNFQAGGVKVGDATFWIIGRDTNAQATSMQGVGDYPVWGLVDEASKVNLNNATAAMLQNLPGMDEYTSAATYDWQSTSTTASTDGAKSDT